MSKAQIIDGKAIAEKLRKTVAEKVAALTSAHDLVPGLAVILVGDDPASQVYVSNKIRQTREAGMNSFEYRLPAETSQDALLARIAALNADPAVHGILVQIPLPDHIDEAAIVAAIDPAKDVDGLHVMNAGLLATGGTGLVPCTPTGCILLIQHVLGSDLSGREAVIVGRSQLVGRPIAQLLLNENCTVTVAHSRSRDLPEICRRADILVVAVGRPEMVRGDWIRPGATVIDVGINRIPAPEKGEGKTRLVGDVAYREAAEVAGAITPVPGGVGPMTVACLLRATVIAACRQNGITAPDF
ncbi:MAG TPA: bifunctional methylenetetrahydrofolate dehydrogenase/methenyltetrahydrofolate cyclohydrolase FolD [Alphaproteobacteria bacterium]|nr:bifunctional methylenetetrahydrofolate dehydrogenase/methenyltetrahydrofolate cyclohydrolase FolD [Alphaproteobacteria bacterium]